MRVFLKSIGKDDDDEEEEERAGSPQLEADLAFEVIFQVSSQPQPCLLSVCQPIFVGLDLTMGKRACSQDKECHR